jgi:hypothetical protein
MLNGSSSDYAGAINLQEGLIQITHSKQLHSFLVSNPYEQSGHLYRQIQRLHELCYGQPINLTKSSFVTEFFGHLIAGHYISKHPNTLKKLLSENFYRRIKRSCEVIDCGDKQRDPNRWFWDLFAWTHRMSAWWYRRLYGTP